VVSHNALGGVRPEEKGEGAWKQRMWEGISVETVVSIHIKYMYIFNVRKNREKDGD
jgi:hypothetical protein